MRLRWCVLATALVLVVTACGGGSGGNTAVADGLGGSTTHDDRGQQRLQGHDR